MAPKPKPEPIPFCAGAKYQAETLVYHRFDGLLYKAKILKVNASDDGFHYFLHYLGWNVRWDKWSMEDELMPDSLEAEALQKELKAASNAEKETLNLKKRKASGNGAGTDKVEGADGGAQKKKNRTPSLRQNTEDDSGQNFPVKLSMPLTLKKQLVDEWERITHEPPRLVPLPRSLTAGQAIDSFVESKKGKSNAQQMTRYKELADALKLYFDKALPLMLLYEQEFKQYHAVQKQNPEAPACDVYGAEHLLRLFVRLPGLLAGTAMTREEITQVQIKLSEFLKFMQKQAGEFFLKEYEAQDVVMAALLHTKEETAQA